MDVADACRGRRARRNEKADGEDVRECGFAVVGVIPPILVRCGVDQADRDVELLPDLAVAALDDATNPELAPDLVALRAMLDRAARPDSVTARAGLLVQHIATAVGGALETFPARPPSLWPARSSCPENRE